MTRAAVEIACANVNLPPGAAVCWGIAKHQEFLHETGYEGFEWHPLRSRLLLEINARALRGAEVTLVTSLHQSWRQRGMAEILRAAAPNRLTAIAAAMVMPHRQWSLRYLRRMQQATGRQLLAVVYPEEQDTDTMTLARPVTDLAEWQPQFAELIFQPTAEVLRRWGVASTDPRTAMAAMRRAMRGSGLAGVCFDTHHWRTTRAGHVLPHWEACLPWLVREGMVREVHVAAGRVDAESSLAGSRQELRDIMAGKLCKTAVGAMLACIADNQPARLPLRIVTEIPATALGKRDVAGVHREIVSAIGQALSEPLAARVSLGS